MDNPTLDELIAQLRHLDPTVPDRQFEAVMVLPKMVDEPTRAQVVDILIEALKAPQALVRAHAAEALGMLGEKKAVEALVRTLKDRYQLARSYAARALGKLGDQDAIEPLLDVLGHDPFFGARAEAAEALRHLCPEEKTPPCQLAREALKIYREEELKRNEERSRRVLAEMDISLKELGAIMSQIEKALQEGKSDYALSLAQTGKKKIYAAQDNRDRMGGLLASRNRVAELI
jgi:hypothetical protein